MSEDRIVFFKILMKVHSYAKYLFSINETDFSAIYNKDDWNYSGRVPKAELDFFYDRYDSVSLALDAEEFITLLIDRVFNEDKFQDALGDNGYIDVICSESGLQIVIKPESQISIEVDDRWFVLDCFLDNCRM